MPLKAQCLPVVTLTGLRLMSGEGCRVNRRFAAGHYVTNQVSKKGKEGPPAPPRSLQEEKGGRLIPNSRTMAKLLMARVLSTPLSKT